jgi:hypothetical protein
MMPNVGEVATSDSGFSALSDAKYTINCGNGIHNPLKNDLFVVRLWYETAYHSWTS